MKKMNSKGFTLIELLAVITIMGILMMVAIPSVSRTIENARRDTFADIAHEYINAIRNNVLADNIECNMGTDAAPNWVVASGTPDGTYYFEINTQSGNTKDLMESGGKSPFGNTEMTGYTVWTKTSTTNARGDYKTKVSYTMALVDSGAHGFKTYKTEAEIKRNIIETSNQTAADAPPSGAKKCQLS